MPNVSHYRYVVAANKHRFGQSQQEDTGITGLLDDIETAGSARVKG